MLKFSGTIVLTRAKIEANKLIFHTQYYYFYNKAHSFQLMLNEKFII